MTRTEKMMAKAIRQIDAARTIIVEDINPIETSVPARAHLRCAEHVAWLATDHLRQAMEIVKEAEWKGDGK